MPDRAQVTSVEAIEAFRSKLIVFISKARAALEEAGDESQRTRAWLESDRRTHWERECRRRGRNLEEAQQALLSARLSGLREATASQSMAVERAKRALHDAEEKREQVRKWLREYESRVEPLSRQMDQLLVFVTSDLGKAAIHLGQLVQILQTYTLAVPGGDASSAPLAVQNEAEADRNPGVNLDLPPGESGVK